MSNLLQNINQHWDDEIIPELCKFIEVPAKSPQFDEKWTENAYIDKVANQAMAWIKRQPIQGLQVELLSLPGRTPVLFFEVAATTDKPCDGGVMFYGHLDKQPEMIGWRDGLSAWSAVIEDGKLYGRGSADDGYAVFSAISALLALQKAGKPHARCVGLIETCEESGSYDLPAYLDILSPRIGNISLIVALDSGCGDYDRLWMTTSLRGMVCGVLRVEVLTEGVHSGDASGIVPSSFRIARQLISRVEDAETGEILPKQFHCKIPDERLHQARVAAGILGQDLIRKYPFVSNMSAVTQDTTQAILNRTWRSALSVTGADGLPNINQAGNVLRPQTSLKLSLRLPPNLDGELAAEQLKQILEDKPPYQAKVSFEHDAGASGWNAAPTELWLSRALDAASQEYYSFPSAAMGEGGSIPFMGMLGRRYPNAQFLITGVLGPHSNAHGPNEFLNLDYAKRLTACVAEAIAAHATVI